MFAVPAHPLFVHVPVVLVPLAALGTVLVALRRSWQVRYGFLLVVVAGLGAAGSALAAGSGEELEHALPRNASSAARRLVHDHVEAGDLARGVSMAFFTLLTLWLGLLWLRRDGTGPGLAAVTGPARRVPARAGPALMVCSGALGLAATVTMIDAGHSGAAAVWCVEDGAC